MRFARYQIEQTEGLAIETGGAARGLMETDRGYPEDLDVLVRKGPPALDKAAKALGAGHPIDLARICRRCERQRKLSVWVLTIADTPRNPVLRNPTIQRSSAGSIRA